MSYLDNILRRGERVLIIAKLHWIQFLSPILWMAIGAGLFVSFVGTEEKLFIWFAALFAILGLARLIGALITHLTTELAVTDRRVILKRGFIRRDTIEQQMERIDSVTVTQSILGRILNYGTLEIRGSGSSFTPLRRIAEPLEVRKAVQYAIEIAMDRREERRMQRRGESARSDTYRY
ncbi:MAG TPA: PH domain-containing protein [Candidatus Sulfotelmatobacter sp.]|nr:PH domain-containing protein [Candidatus Sulfotelmatobacter sp.]